MEEKGVNFNSDNAALYEHHVFAYVITAPNDITSHYKTQSILLHEKGQQSEKRIERLNQDVYVFFLQNKRREETNYIRAGWNY